MHICEYFSHMCIRTVSYTVFGVVRHFSMSLVIIHPNTLTINFHPFDLTERAMTLHEKFFQTTSMTSIISIINVYPVEYVKCDTPFKLSDARLHGLPGTWNSLT